MNKIYIIGVGPGTEDYLLPIALRRIQESHCLIAAPRIVKTFKYLKKETIPLKSNFNTIIPYIKKYHNKKRIAVLVSGDPGLYSISQNITKELRQDEYEVIPGISSLQIAFARIGKSWQDAKIISLHGRGAGNLPTQVRKNAKVFLFADEDLTPDKIAAYLISKGIDNRKAIVLENLGYPDERIVNTSLRNLSKMKGFGLCVMILL